MSKSERTTPAPTVATPNRTHHYDGGVDDGLPACGQVADGRAHQIHSARLLRALALIEADDWPDTWTHLDRAAYFTAKVDWLEGQEHIVICSTCLTAVREVDGGMPTDDEIERAAGDPR